MELNDLRQANVLRQRLWTGNEYIDMPFRAIELGGEVGELLNKIKKYLRATRGIKGNTPEDALMLMQDIRDEMADVIISLDLLAIEIGVDLDKAVPEKFNKTSHEKDVPVFMETD